MSPQGSDAGSGKQFFSLSAGSYLDRLPPELREKIYKLVMADWNWTRWLHIVRDYEREDYQIIGYSHAMGTSRKRLLTYVPCVSVREEEPKLSMCTRFPTRRYFSRYRSCRCWQLAQMCLAIVLSLHKLLLMNNTNQKQNTTLAKAGKRYINAHLHTKDCT